MNDTTPTRHTPPQPPARVVVSMYKLTMVRFRLALLLIVSASAGCTWQETRAAKYKGYIDVPVRTKVPMWLVENENFQGGPGKSGYVLMTFQGPYVVGILPIGHPVLFKKAYSSIQYGGGSDWMEGTMRFKRKEYPIQFDFTDRNGGDSVNNLRESFRSVQE